MTPNSGAQHTLAPERLLDFLIADLDLCFMLLNTDYKVSDSEEYHSALEKAYKELLAIRKLKVASPPEYSTNTTRVGLVFTRVGSAAGGDYNRVSVHV
jgi:hypothetical protein